MVPVIYNENSITLFVEGKSLTADNSHPNFAEIVERVKAKNFHQISALFDRKHVLGEVIQDGLVINDFGATFKGMNIEHNAIFDRILKMREEGFDTSPLIKFLENLLQNPSRTAVQELYLFLESGKLPITEDGHFLAYKKVQDDYLDFYTRKMDNSVGKILEVPRNSVDDNRDNTCSYGLHFCSLKYLPAYHGGAGRIMIVKINPKDVVSIPSDYENTKGRTCRYEVIGEHLKGEYEEFTESSVWFDENEAEEEYEEDYECEYESEEEFDSWESDSEETPPEKPSYAAKCPSTGRWMSQDEYLGLYGNFWFKS